MKPRIVVVVTDPTKALKLFFVEPDPSIAWAIHLRYGPAEDNGFDEMVTHARDLGVPCIASVAPELVHPYGLDGIHLGGARRAGLSGARQSLGPRAWISVPAHTDDEVEEGAARGASAMYVSPVFATPGKGPPRGLEAVRRAREIARDRSLVYALGGVDETTAEACTEAGADGVAVVRAVLDAPDPHAALAAIDAAVLRGLASRSAS